MLKISNLTVKTKENNKTILENINLKFEAGEIYAISGQNGSGKSTLAQAIIGNPEYILAENSKLIYANKVSSQKDQVEQKIIPPVKGARGLESIDIVTLTPDQRSHLGIFVSMQYPTEVPGVGFLNYLKLIIELNRKSRNLGKLTSKQTLDLIHSKLELIGWLKDILNRNLNEGLSGGERKKSEILQMLLLDPQLIILDEIDSGLDKESLEIIVKIIKKFITKNKTLILITHQQKMLDLLKPDQIIYLKNGKVV
jgi:Fe-S cluster assembly ATP-binding protein